LIGGLGKTTGIFFLCGTPLDPREGLHKEKIEKEEV